VNRNKTTRFMKVRKSDFTKKHLGYKLIIFVFSHALGFSLPGFTVYLHNKYFSVIIKPSFIYLGRTTFITSCVSGLFGNNNL
jgi:hypothetical protein